VHGEGEEVDAGPRAQRTDRSGQHDRLAVACNDRAIGLACNLAGLKDELPAAPFDFLFVDLEHSLVPSFPEAGLPRGLSSVVPKKCVCAGPRPSRASREADCKTRETGRQRRSPNREMSDS